MSLAPVLRSEERVLIINDSRILRFSNSPSPHCQTQIRADQAGVLWKRWRLRDNRELYNLNTEPLQQTNVIDQHPEVVAKLGEHLAAWWDRVGATAIKEQPINVGSGHEDSTKLSATEWLDVFIDQQGQILRGQHKSGYWTCVSSTTSKSTPMRGRFPFDSERYASSVSTLEALTSARGNVTVPGT